jgi:hypothetical protein
MPGPKVKAASLGKALREVVARTSPASAVRFATTPTDPDLAKMQEDLRAAVGGVGGGKNPFSQGALLELDFADGLDQTVPHKLGGEVSGFIIVDMVADSPTVIVRRTASSLTPIEFGREPTHVRFVASAVCQAKLWVWR